MLISDSLHNSLVILSVTIFIVVCIFIVFKQLRIVWQHVNIVYNQSSNNHVLLLESSELSELRNVLTSVDDIHPRQIRRILRQTLDSNIVKNVPISRPDLFIKNPMFHNKPNQYIFGFEHFIKEEQKGVMCFDFYFGVPKSYSTQLKAMSQLSNTNCTNAENENMNSDNGNGNELHSIVSFATKKFQPKIQRIYSKSSMETGIEMTEMTSMTSRSDTSEMTKISMHRLIPNNYVYKDFYESKSGENISFDKKELETTINAIIGNNKVKLMKKKGEKTKYSSKAQKEDASNSENEFYFCVVFNYVKYERNESKNEEKESEMESGTDYLEISMFEAPSAFSRTQTHSRPKTKEKSDSEKLKSNEKRVTNALEPSLFTKVYADFKLQRLVEYYDIFGISSDQDNCDINLDCKICFSFPANIVLLPCRHCCCCLSCYKHIDSCPMCRKPIRQTLRWKYN